MNREQARGKLKNWRDHDGNLLWNMDRESLLDRLGIPEDSTITTIEEANSAMLSLGETIRKWKPEPPRAETRRMVMMNANRDRYRYLRSTFHTMEHERTRFCAELGCTERIPAKAEIKELDWRDYTDTEKGVRRALLDIIGKVNELVRKAST